MDVQVLALFLCLVVMGLGAGGILWFPYRKALRARRDGEDRRRFRNTVVVVCATLLAVLVAVHYLLGAVLADIDHWGVIAATFTFLYAMLAALFVPTAVRAAYAMPKQLNLEPGTKAWAWDRVQRYKRVAAGILGAGVAVSGLYQWDHPPVHGWLGYTFAVILVLVGCAVVGAVGLFLARVYLLGILVAVAVFSAGVDVSLTAVTGPIIALGDLAVSLAATAILVAVTKKNDDDDEDHDDEEHDDEDHVPESVVTFALHLDSAPTVKISVASGDCVSVRLVPSHPPVSSTIVE